MANTAEPTTYEELHDLLEQARVDHPELHQAEQAAHAEMRRSFDAWFEVFEPYENEQRRGVLSSQYNPPDPRDPATPGYDLVLVADKADTAFNAALDALFVAGGLESLMAAGYQL